VPGILGGRARRVPAPADGARLSRACIFAVWCRDPTLGGPSWHTAGACWGSYGYAPVLPQLREQEDSPVAVRGSGAGWSHSGRSSPVVWSTLGRDPGCADAVAPMRAFYARESWGRLHAVR